MKSDGDKQTSADRGAAAYGDHASNNTAITGPVGGDVVLLNVPPSPSPSGGVHDHKAIREYDAALGLKRAVLGMRNTMSSVRNVGSGTDFRSKLSRTDEAASALYAELREAEAHWERKVWEISDPFRLCVRKLQQNIDRYMTYSQQSKPVPPSLWEQIDSIIWENDLLNDPFTREIEEAVDKILSFLDPYLNPPRN